ncbi:hypothetical protein DL769_005691 [Monosporascus sp. CRB-8-3]|nr:hypothetical protein DL769_005691 [Monosporascus sp. CRB-8-3]
MRGLCSNIPTPDRHPPEVVDTTISNLISFVNIGAGVGAFLSFFLNDKVGRLWSMRLYQVLYAVGSLISCFSYGNHGVLYFGRILAGLGVGACTVVGPMAIAELAPRTVRGPMTLWFNVGMFGAQALGVFTRIKHQQFHDIGYWAIMNETFTIRSNLRRVQLIIVAYILAQFSGANSIINYLPTILGLIGVKGSGAKVDTSGLYSVAKLVCCVITSPVFVDVVGRRKSPMIGINYHPGGLPFVSRWISELLHPQLRRHADWRLGCCHRRYLYSRAGLDVGLYTLPYLFGAELWPNRIRSFGGALSQCFHRLFYFAITKATLGILQSMDTRRPFIFFVSWCIIAFLYTLFFVPETSSLILEEIDAIFQRSCTRDET